MAGQVSGSSHHPEPMRSTHRVRIFFLALLAVVLILPDAWASAATRTTAIQFGTPEYDQANTVTASISGVYVGGWTAGTLPGQTSSGWNDAFISRVSPQGTPLWTRQFGTTWDDDVDAAVSDWEGVYVVATVGGWAGGSGKGVILKYSPNGDELWSHDLSPTQAWPTAIAIDGTGVYAAGRFGYPGDAFVTKYSFDGELQWTRTFQGSQPYTVAVDLATDPTGVYLTGETGDPDVPYTRLAIIRKYDPDGKLLWYNEFTVDAAQTSASSLVADQAGHIYLAGSTGCTSSGGVPPCSTFSPSSFLARYTAGGRKQWLRDDLAPYYASRLALEGGVLWAAGNEYTALDGQSSPNINLWVRSHRLSDGAVLSTREMGTPDDDLMMDFSSYGSSLYEVGLTFGTLPGQTNLGPCDAFLLSRT